MRDRAAKIRLGLRGEGVIYRAGDREAQIDSTWINGRRLYAETIRRWSDGSPIPDAQRAQILRELVHFLAGRREKPIVVINSDDPDRELWDRLCDEMQATIAGVERSSDAQNSADLKRALLPAVQSGLVIDDTKISSEAQLDAALARLARRDDPGHRAG